MSSNVAKSIAKRISAMGANKFVLFDCDTGSDDAIALMMLLSESAKKNVKTVAITCVDGNTALPNVVMNNLRLLKLYNMLDDIPVYRGCSEPLLPLSSHGGTGSIHGSDGMGGHPEYEPRSDPELLKHVQEKPAACAIVDLAKKYANELTIVATGPLTNLAVALKLDPDLPSKVKNLYIMGGTREGAGNVTPAAEFNFYVDPEAAQITLMSFSPKCLTFITDYGFCKKFSVSMQWVENDWLGNIATEKQGFAHMALQTLIKFYKDRYGNAYGFSICDAYTMSTVLDTTIAWNPVEFDCFVETGGVKSRGHLILNHTRSKHEGFNGPIVFFDNFDVDKYKQMLIDAVA